MNATIAERQPPANFEAEQSLLGVILTNNSAWSQAAEIVRAEHFADPLHGRLFDALGRLIERGQVVSAFTLKTYAETDEGLKAAGGGTYLARLMSASIFAHDVPAVARAVRDCATRRGLISVLSDALPAAYDEGHEVAVAEQIEAVERGLYDLADGQIRGGFEPFTKALTEAVKTAEAAHNKAGGMVGLPTGLRDVDELLGGLQRSDLVIVAGRPGMGKSALASNMGFAAAGSGVTVGFFSLEMSAEQLATRIIAEQAGVPTEKVRRGQLNANEFDRVLGSAETLQALPLYMDDTAGLTIGGLRTRARRLKRKHGLGLVIVDYLQLIDGGQRQRENRVQEVSEITRGLKAIAKELDVPVLALSQLSRKVEDRSDKRPQLADLRDSGTIEQDADIVMFIYREEYYRRLLGQNWSDVASQAELSVAKQRHGPTGMVHLKFDGPTTRFSDVDRSDQ